MRGDMGRFRIRFGEVATIVGSILVAFALDAGWDGMQDRREEAKALQALADEYETNLEELDRTVARHRRLRAVTEWGLNATEEEIAGLSPREVGEVLYSLGLPYTFDPNLGTTEALRSSGRLSLLRDDALPRLLMEFATRDGDTQEDRNYIGGLAMRIWEEEVRLGGPWMAPEAMGITTPGVSGMRDARVPDLGDLRRVRADALLPSLLRRYHLNVGIYLSELAAQREVLERIRDRLPSPSPDAGEADDPRALLLDPGHPAWSEAAPDSFDAVFETTAGEFRMRVHRGWAPIGVDRFWNLARHGFYDDARFHRVVPGFITQFGISGDPEVDAVWYDRGMPDDPVVESNVRGTVAYAFTEPGTRATQLYVNMVDNVRLDSAGFAPIGRVVSGMHWTVDSIFGGYGEDSGGGVRRGNQAPLVEGGNDWIDREYPELDRIVRVRIEPLG